MFFDDDEDDCDCCGGDCQPEADDLIEEIEEDETDDIEE